jgi:histidine ammonia-lyase
MGAARRLRPMLGNLQNILAIELLCACQGIDLLAPLQTGTVARRVHAAVRRVSTKVEHDRSLGPDIATVAEVIAAGQIAGIIR